MLTLRNILNKSNARLLFSLRLFNTRVEEAQHECEVIPENETNQKLLKLAVIGLPNAGKSTFINNLMDRKVFYD